MSGSTKFSPAMMRALVRGKVPIYANGLVIKLEKAVRGRARFSVDVIDQNGNPLLTLNDGSKELRTGNTMTILRFHEAFTINVTAT
jgi:hypothetical protein